jgi:hypothetical protein
MHHSASTMVTCAFVRPQDSTPTIRRPRSLRFHAASLSCSTAPALTQDTRRPTPCLQRRRGRLLIRPTCGEPGSEIQAPMAIVILDERPLCDHGRRPAHASTSPLLSFRHGERGTEATDSRRAHRSAQRSAHGAKHADGRVARGPRGDGAARFPNNHRRPKSRATVGAELVSVAAPAPRRACSSLPARLGLESKLWAVANSS